MAARNDRPQSGASRANKNTQGAGKPKTAGKKNVVKGRRGATTGASRSKKQGLVKIPRKQSSPKMVLSNGQPSSAQAAWSKYSKSGPKY